MKNLDNNTQDIQLTDGQIKYKITRQLLIEKSNKAREFRQRMIDEASTLEESSSWAELRINDILKLWHQEETGATDFNTFWGWKKDGYSVKKGEKAFVLWGRKRTATETTEMAKEQNFDANTEDPQENSYDFFPIAYLFTDLQVEKRGRKQPKAVFKSITPPQNFKDETMEEVKQGIQEQQSHEELNEIVVLD